MWLVLKYISTNGSPLKCMFYQTTGLYCPGCGTGRAIHQLIHLNFIEAFQYNQIFIILLPFLLYYGLKIYIKFIYRDILPFNIPRKFDMSIIIVIILYFIIRNINIYPFTYLQP